MFVRMREYCTVFIFQENWIEVERNKKLSSLLWVKTYMDAPPTILWVLYVITSTRKIESECMKVELFSFFFFVLKNVSNTHLHAYTFIKKEMEKTLR